MSLFSVRGRFANNFTFSVNPVDADDARDALSVVTGSDEIRKYASDNSTEINMITVKKLSGSKKKVHISDKPAAERKGGRKKKVVAETPAETAPEAPAATPPKPAQQPAPARRR